MLNVPEEVKDLFKQDGVRKNFRVHFPNGEHEDLINTDLESESVKFTESIQSGNDFKYGIIEGNSLEFRAHNLDYVTGCTIEAQLEIEAYPSQVQSYTVDYWQLGDGGIDEITELSPYMISTSELYFTRIYISTNRIARPTTTTCHLSITFYTEDQAIIGTIYPTEHKTSISTPSFSDFYWDLDLSNIDKFLSIKYIQIHYDDDYDPDPGQLVDILAVNVQFTFQYCPVSYPEDLDYPVVALPYGVFIIDSCKKDVQNNVRTVIAYQNNYSDADNMFSLCDVEKYKMRRSIPSIYSDSEYYKFNLFPFLYGNTGTLPSDDFINGFSYCIYASSEKYLEYEINGQDLPYFLVTTIQSSNYSLTLYSSYFLFYDDYGSWDNWTINGFKTSKVIEDSMDRCYGLRLPSHYNTLEELKQDIIEEFNEFPDILSCDFGSATNSSSYPRYTNLEGMYYPITSVINTNTSSIPPSNFNDKRYACILSIKKNFEVIDDTLGGNNDFNCIFPFYVYNSGAYGTSYTPGAQVVLFTSRAVITRRSDNFSRTFDINTHTVIPEYAEFTTGFILDEYTFNNSNTKINCRLQFERDAIQGTSSTSYNAAFLVQELNIKDLLNAYCEIASRSIKFNRQNHFTVFYPFTGHGLYPDPELYPDSDLYPLQSNEQITRNLIKSVWWDDIIFRYKKLLLIYDNTNISYEIYSNGTNVYTFDFKSNKILSNLTYTPSDTQLDNLAESIIQGLKVIQYYRSNITMKGLPYLEVGDVITVFTREGGFETCIFRRTLTGIQALTDTIDVQ